ncbi:MAG: polysaccharide biosynthesis tyrosine autokinase [Gaiellaceae bacterium]|jgi:polysaccharide biosynthesis transport protein
MTEIEPLRRSRGQAEDGVAARQRASLPSSRPSASARDPEASERREGLVDLLDALRWRWPVALSIAAAFTLGAVLYVESLPSKYDAHALVSFSPRPNVQGAGSDTVRVLVPKYPSYVIAPATVARVARSIGADPDVVQSEIDAHVTTDTGTMTITARANGPGRAAHLANAFAADVVAASRRDPLLQGQLLAPAVPPTSAAAPHRRLLEFAALLIGLLGGIGLSILIERGRPRLRTWRDMAAMTGYPVLGRIPPARALRSRPMDAMGDPKVGASFRTLRANLEPLAPDGKLNVLVVTSATTGDGKTTTSALLAETLARRGMKVLLIDADLRRSRLSHLLAEQPHGLAAVMRGEAKMRDVVRPGWVPGLLVTPTEISDDAGDLLARRFGALAAEARERFDVVVVDSPPLLGTDDARTLAAAADGVLLVVSARSNPSEVNEAILALESLRAPLMGLVANRLKESKNVYYYN